MATDLQQTQRIFKLRDRNHNTLFPFVQPSPSAAAVQFSDDMPDREDYVERSATAKRRKHAQDGVQYEISRKLNMDGRLYPECSVDGDVCLIDGDSRDSFSHDQDQKEVSRTHLYQEGGEPQQDADSHHSVNIFQDTVDLDQEKLSPSEGYPAPPHVCTPEQRQDTRTRRRSLPLQETVFEEGLSDKGRQCLKNHERDDHKTHPPEHMLVDHPEDNISLYLSSSSSSSSSRKEYIKRRHKTRDNNYLNQSHKNSDAGDKGADDANIADDQEATDDVADDQEARDIVSDDQGALAYVVPDKEAHHGSDNAMKSKGDRNNDKDANDDVVDEDSDEGVAEENNTDDDNSAGGYEEEDEEDEEEEEEDGVDETLEGFIVQEAEETDHGSQNEEEEEDDEEPVLDEDDLDLIAENTGTYYPRPSSSKFRRLKKIDDTSDEDTHTDIKEKSMDGLKKKITDGTKDGAWDDSVEDDQDLSDEDFSDEDVYGMHPEVIQLIREIFKDVKTVLEILGCRRHRDEYGEDGAKDSSSPYREDERQDAVDHTPSEEDVPGRCNKKIREPPRSVTSRLDAGIYEVNKPERYLMYYKNRKTHYSSEELKKEASWISSRIANNAMLDTLDLDPQALDSRYKQTFGSKSCYYDPSTTSVQQDMKEKINLFLHFLLNERLEVPTILLHYGHRVCPPLTERLAWLIVDLDQEWSRLSRDAECVSNLVERIPSRDPDLAYLQSKLNTFEGEHDIDDVRHYVNFYYKDLTAGEMTRAGRKQAASCSGISLNDVERHGIDAHWRPYILSPHDFATNLRNSKAIAQLVCGTHVTPSEDLHPQVLTPSEPQLPGRSREALESWLGSFATGPFNTSSRVLEALLALESRKLAVSVPLRDCLRRWFYTTAQLTTVLTDAGQTAVPIGKRSWSSLTMRRKPVSNLLNATAPPLTATTYEDCRRQMDQREYAAREATAFLDILHAESLGHVTLVIHPLTAHESAPWRVNEETEEASAKTTSLLQAKTYDTEDSATVDNLIRLLTDVYVTSRTSIWATQVQIPILERVVFRELFTLFRKELRYLLQRRAEACVAVLCYDVFKWKLSLGPFIVSRENVRKNDTASSDDAVSDHSDSDAALTEDEEVEEEEEEVEEAHHTHPVDHRAAQQRHRTPRVCSLVIEHTAKQTRVHAVCVDRQGGPTNYLLCDCLFPTERKNKSGPTARNVTKLNEDALKELQQFLQKCVCDVVVVGASCFFARDLYKAVSTFAQKLSTKRQFKVFYAPMEVPRLYASSTLCCREHKRTYGMSGCQGIALARFVQYPLSSYLQLWCEESTGRNLLLYLKYHPLQHLLLPERLEACLEQAAVIVVASVGVDINELRRKPHKQALLQFVPGFGRRTALFVLSSLTAPLHTREDLLKLTCASTAKLNNHQPSSLSDDPQTCPEGISSAIYHNCASFIRFPRSSCLRSDAPDPLACTRAHPIENYATAYKMARDALEDVRRSTTSQQCVISVIRHPRCLDELDFEAYSYILEAKGQSRMLSHLEMIRKELENPFEDPRFSFQEPSEEELFYMLTQENRFDFLPGCEVVAHVTECRGNGTVNFLIPPSAVPAVPIDVSSYVSQQSSHHGRPLTTSQFRHTLFTLLPVGVVLSAYIHSIDYENFLVSLVLSQSQAASLLASILPLQNPGLISPQISVNAITSVLQDRVKKRSTAPTCTQNALSGKPSRVIVRRRIDHPRFRMMLPSRVAHELRHGNIGDALITPNEGSLNQLLLTIKVCKNPCIMKTVVVHEYDQPSRGELGKSLRIGNSDYVNLDLIFGQYVEGLRVNLDETFAFEKYYGHQTLQDIEAMLVAAQKKKSLTTGTCTIEWGITIDISYPANRPGVRFYLIAIPPPPASSTTNQSIGKPPLILKDGIYVTHEGFKLWNKKESSIRRLINWWKTHGYFQRSKLLAEYNATKKKLLEESRPPCRHTTASIHDTASTKRKNSSHFTTSPHRSKPPAWNTFVVPPSSM